MKKLLLIALILTGVFSTQAQEAELNKYKSLFTINFIRYINWPTGQSGDFVIGVLKNSALATEIEAKTTGKKVGFQNIVVKEFTSVESLTPCQVLYVDNSANYQKNADLISQKVKGANALIITESAGAITKGAAINFVMVDNVLKFEISASNADQNGLKISSILLSMNNAIQK